MRMPDSLASLVDEGIVDEVVRPLMSGKEAQVYLVLAGGTERVAKVYKDAQNRTFKHRTSYTEGRKVRNSRDQRAISKRSKHGRAEDEAAWKSTEVDMIYRLQAAGVRVPAPYQFIDGVLVMELITGAGGGPAPRMGDGDFTPEQAAAFHVQLLGEVVKMLCAGVVHGDLSEFNVLIGIDGPVIIDLPQAVDASKNQNARKLLLRDVANLNRFVARYVPGAGNRPYAEEMWALYESSRLAPDTVLRGVHRASAKKADTDALLELVDEVNEDERRRRTAKGLDATKLPARRRRVEIVASPPNARANKSTASRRRRAPSPLAPQPPRSASPVRPGTKPAHGTSPVRPAMKPARGTPPVRSATKPARGTPPVRSATKPARGTSPVRPATKPARGTPSVSSAPNPPRHAAPKLARRGAPAALAAGDAEVKPPARRRRRRRRRGNSGNGGPPELGEAARAARRPTGK